MFVMMIWLWWLVCNDVDDDDRDDDDDDRDDDDRDDDSDDDRDDDDNTTSLLTAMVPSDRSIYQSIYISLFYLLGIVGLTLKEAQQQILHHQE